MKNIAFILLSIITLSSAVYADGIQFQKLDWEENLKTAKAQNKLVYVDFYTTWCGPCKFMSKTYFPTKEAGDLYNKNFLCLKVDAEKEGVELAKKYKIAGYPTNIFVNPTTEEIVYKAVGAPQKIEGFLENATTALEEFNDPMSLEDYSKKMEEGDSSKAFTMKYLKKLTRLDQSNQWPLDVYSSAYFKNPPQKADYEFMDQYMKDINNNTFELFKKNKKGYNQFAKNSHPDYQWADKLESLLYASARTASQQNNGQLYSKCVQISNETFSANKAMDVSYFITKSFSRNVDSLLHLKNEYDYADKLTGASNSYYKEGDAKGLQSFMKYLDGQSKKWKPEQLAKLDSLKKAYSKDKKYSMQTTLRSIDHLNSQAWNVFENDGDRWEQALPWAKKAYTLSKKSQHSVAAVADTYANLLYATGKKQQAIQIEKEAIKQAKKENEDFSSYEETLKKFEGK